MDLDQSTTTSIFSFFMKVTAAVSMVFLSKLYKIVLYMEEDKNHKYNVTYYKISELENYIEALQNDVTHMKETCVLLEDKLAMQKVLLQHAYHTLPQEDVRETNEVISGATNELISDATNGPTNELEDVSGTTSELEVLNKDANVGTLTSIKEETINPDYIEEKNRTNLDPEYEHVVNASSIDTAPKYKLWKGVY